MPLWISDFCDAVSSSWSGLTPYQFGQFAILIVLVGWAITRVKR